MASEEYGIFLLALMCSFLVHSSPSEAGDLGEIVFDCYHVNFAWGYILKGFYIDRDGRIYNYDRKGDPWLPNSVRKGSHSYPGPDLMSKFRNRKSAGEIDPSLLKEKVALIEPASGGKIYREPMLHDAGWFGCVAYLFDERNDIYTAVTLGAWGDFTERNSSQEAQSLLSWLTSLRVQ
jgi:hypothetical protein